MLPASSFPRDSNTALGEKKVTRWEKVMDKKARFQALIMSLMLTPVGIWGVTQDPNSLFGWMFVVFGTYSTIFLFIMQYYDKEKLEKEIVDLRRRVDDLDRR